MRRLIVECFRLGNKAGLALSDLLVGNDLVFWLESLDSKSLGVDTLLDDSSLAPWVSDSASMTSAVSLMMSSSDSADC
jgi:hypothetical protein